MKPTPERKTGRLGRLMGAIARRAIVSPASQSVEELSDYYLRDIGLVRERGMRPRSHLLWM